MKVDFNFNFTDLDLKPIENFHAGKKLATHLANSNNGDYLKMYGWALKLNNEESLDLDESDTQTLNAFIQNEQGFTNLIKAQLKAVFDKK